MNGFVEIVDKTLSLCMMTEVNDLLVPTANL